MPKKKLKKSNKPRKPKRLKERKEMVRMHLFVTIAQYNKLRLISEHKVVSMSGIVRGLIDEIQLSVQEVDDDEENE